MRIANTQSGREELAGLARFGHPDRHCFLLARALVELEVSAVGPRGVVDETVHQVAVGLQPEVGAMQGVNEVHLWPLCAEFASEITHGCTSWLPACTLKGSCS